MPDNLLSTAVNRANTPKQYLYIVEEQSATLNAWPAVDNGIRDFTFVMKVMLHAPGALISHIMNVPGEDNHRMGIIVWCTQDAANPKLGLVHFLFQSGTFPYVISCMGSRPLFDLCLHTIAVSITGDVWNLYIDGDKLRIMQTAFASPSAPYDTINPAVFDFAAFDLTKVTTPFTVGGAAMVPTVYHNPVSPGDMTKLVSTGSVVAAFYRLGAWSSGLSDAQTRHAAFCFLDGLDPNILAYWPFDGSLKDASPNGKDLVMANPTFYPSYQSFWANNPDYIQRTAVFNSPIPYNEETLPPLCNYSFYQVEGLPFPVVNPSLSIGLKHRVLIVKCDVLFGTITGRGASLGVPNNVGIRLVSPDNDTSYYTPQNTDKLLTKINAANMLLTFAIRDPKPGIWEIEVITVGNPDFVFQMQALPTKGKEQVAIGRHLALRNILMGFTTDNMDHPRTRAMGGGLRTVFHTVAAVGVAGLMATATIVGLPFEIAAAPLVVFVLVVSAELATADAAAVKVHVDSMNRQDNIAATGQTADFIFADDTQKKKVLLIDANTKNPNGIDGQDTDLAFAYRQRFVYPLLTGADGFKYDHVSINSAQANKKNVEDSLRDPNVVYVSACGHGREDRLMGYWLPGKNDIYEEIINTSTDKSLTRGKIFHFLACFTGATWVNQPGPQKKGLGRWLTTEGEAKAFIGYLSQYKIGKGKGERAGYDTCEADAMIDRVLLQGGTVQEALNAAKAAYEAKALKLESPAIGRKDMADILRMNSRLLVALGDMNARI